MASLRIEIRESISINESNYNSYNTQTIKNINDISKRVVTVPVTESVLVAMDNDQIGAGTFKEESVRYIRITNRSKLYPLLLTLKNEGNDEFIYKLDKQASFIYTGESTLEGPPSIKYNLTGSGVRKSMNADREAIADYTELGDLVNITAYASASEATIISGSAGSGSGVVSCNVEMFIASI
mgnify:CR=1 FL=1